MPVTPPIPAVPSRNATPPRMILCLAALALATAGCEEKQIEPPKKPATPSASSAPAAEANAPAVKGKEAANAWQSMRDAAVRTGESSLAAAKSAVDAAGEKIARLPEMAQAPLKSALEGVKAQYDAAATKLTELKRSDESTWSSIADGLNGMLSKLSETTKALTDKLPK